MVVKLLPLPTERRLLMRFNVLVRFPRQTFTTFFILLFTLVLGVSSPAQSPITPQQPERRRPQPDVVLEFTLPNSPRPPFNLEVTKGGRSMTLIRREQLKVINPQAAANITAVDIWADGEEEAVKVRLSIIY